MCRKERPFEGYAGTHPKADLLLSAGMEAMYYCLTPHLFICTSKWTSREAINDGFGDIGMSLEITINKKQTGYGEVTIFPLVNLLTFYSVMDAVQGIMKCWVIDGASRSFRGLEDPLSGGWRAAQAAKRCLLCLWSQQLA
jgi:hypothetical protein